MWEWSHVVSNSSIKFCQFTYADSFYHLSWSAMWECEGGPGKWYQVYYLQPRLPGTHLAGASFARQTPPRSRSIPRWSRPSSTSLQPWRWMQLSDVPTWRKPIDHGPGYPLQVSWTLSLVPHKFHPNFSSSRWRLTIPEHQGVTLDLCNSLWMSEYTSYQFYFINIYEVIDYAVLHLLALSVHVAVEVWVPQGSLGGVVRAVRRGSLW